MRVYAVPLTSPSVVDDAYGEAGAALLRDMREQDLRHGGYEHERGPPTHGTAEAMTLTGNGRGHGHTGQGYGSGGLGLVLGAEAADRAFPATDAQALTLQSTLSLTPSRPQALQSADSEDMYSPAMHSPANFLEDAALQDQDDEEAPASKRERE